MIITLGGTPGSGKTSLGKRLAKRLGFRFYDAGDVWRKYAIEHRMTLEELQEQAKSDPTTDRMVDDYLKEMGEKEDSLVIDARLGYHFIPHSIKVFVDADEEVRAKRVFKDRREAEKFKDLEDAKKKIASRLAADRKRYEQLYGIDPFSPSHFDLILDTTHKSIDKGVGEVYRFAMFESHPPKRK